MTITEKSAFLQKDLFEKLQNLSPDAQPIFGKMNPLQMIDHLIYSIELAYGKIPVQAQNTPEITAKMYQFMMSDKPFKDNTPNALLPDTPPKAHYDSMPEALGALQESLNYFNQYFLVNKDIRVLNAFFGNLNYEEQISLLYKHFTHHLRQFGL